MWGIGKFSERSLDFVDQFLDEHPLADFAASAFVVLVVIDQLGDLGLQARLHRRDVVGQRTQGVGTGA